MVVNENTNFYVTKIGYFNESNTAIKRNTFDFGYTMKPKDGDFYLRYNPQKKAIFCFRFNGKENKFYDRDFGAGEETYYGNMVNFKSFANSIEESPKEMYNLITDKINKIFMNVEGIKIWNR